MGKGGGPTAFAAAAATNIEQQARSIEKVEFCKSGLANSSPVGDVSSFPAAAILGGEANQKWKKDWPFWLNNKQRK